MGGGIVYVIYHRSSGNVVALDWNVFYERFICRAFYFFCLVFKTIVCRVLELELLGIVGGGVNHDYVGRGNHHIHIEQAYRKTD